MNGRQLSRVRAEEHPQGSQVWQVAGVEGSGKLLGQFTLAAAIMSQRQQFDGDLASLPLGQLLDEGIKGPAIFLPGKELVAIDETQKCHRLFAQGMNNVPVIDDLIVPTVGMAAPSRQCHQMRPADEDLKAIVEQTHRSRWPIRRDGTV